MAHFACIENGIVTQVIVVSNDDAPDPYPESESLGQQFIADVLRLPGEWKQTSYNGNFRGNYGSMGYRYDNDYDAFIPPQPFVSWVLNTSTFQWEAPVPYPDDGLVYVWEETSREWQAL